MSASPFLNICVTRLYHERGADCTARDSICAAIRLMNYDSAANQLAQVERTIDSDQIIDHRRWRHLFRVGCNAECAELSAEVSSVARIGML